MTPDELRSLQQFFGSQFHEDWDLNGPTWEAVVARFVTVARGQLRLTRLAALIAMFVDEHMDDIELATALHRDLRCSYLPEEGPRGWLLSVAGKLRDAEPG